jgi:antibiotic biosynthesis monooxygenase (ABM) superfamily enzyme
MTKSPEHLLVVRARVDGAAEAAWNAWYDEKHLPEIGSCPGFLTANRYVAEVDGQREYLTVYTLESEAALQTQEFAARRGWEQFVGKVEAHVRYFKRIGGLA